MRFIDRREAGRRLAGELQRFADERPVIVALPRGGVPVAVEIARALNAPLDLLAVRKLGAPGRPEFAVGAVAEDRVGVFDEGRSSATGMTQDLLDRTLDREAAELERRVAAYRHGRPPISVDGRTVILVDDGLATGLTDLAAVRAVRGRGAARVVVAAPVASREAVTLLRREADDVVCVMVSQSLRSIGEWYEDFSEVADAEVTALLAGAGTAGARAAVPISRVRVGFGLPHGRFEGDLALPDDAEGIVLFAHGSGSSRFSARNRAVADALNDRRLATLLFDLLTERESANRAADFDIPLLAERLESAARWTLEDDRLAGLPLGLFGASTGAAAAIRAAAELGHAVGAVVSRSGRPDLAADRLTMVTAPTLLIVGAHDHDVLELNRRAAGLLRCPHDLAVVEGAAHLFEEPGALEAVAQLAGDWFAHHFAASPAAAASR
jgi:putative phosphoribosyl transferase